MRQTLIQLSNRATSTLTAARQFAILLVLTTVSATSGESLAVKADPAGAPAFVEPTEISATQDVWKSTSAPIVIRADATIEPLAGEPVNGFANWSERVIHEWINRARSDPQFEMAQCGSACGEAGCYLPVAPLPWSEALNRAARFHAAEMLTQGYFGHDSKCAVVPNINSLYPTGCDGSPSCACTGGSLTCASGGCTTWAVRVALFGAGPMGEIIASGPDPNSAFYRWLYEPATPATCGFNVQNGHRFLILQASGGLGAGVAGASVVDFGNATQSSKIVSAAHYPRQAASIDVWANWFDAAAPKSASVVVDGKCNTMTLMRGTQTNGAWSATVAGMGSGCHRYYVAFTDASGAQVTWPATGSLGIGDESCVDWNSSRLTGSCSATTPSPPTPKTKRRSVRR